MRRENFIRQIILGCVLLLACAASSFARQAGGSITGRVMDAQGAGVPGATVTLYARARTQLRLSTTTDSTGAYRFERLAAGAYLVEAESEGFARAVAHEVNVEKGAAAAPLDITLEVAGVTEEVIITASDSPQTVDEVSKAVSVVGRKEIEERDEFSITDALRTVPGLRVQQLGGPGAFTTIKTRGLRNQDTAVLFDGVRFRDPTSPQGDASGFLSDLVVTDASRVEVLRGSGSSLYGTNAIGGVVNIVTDEGGGPFHGSLLAEGGGLGFARGRAQVSGGVGASDRFVYSAALSHLNVSRGVDSDDATRNTSVQGRALLRLTPTVTLSARLYASDSFLQLNENPQVFGAVPATGIIEARPLARSEQRRFESGTSVSALNVGDTTFIPGPNDADNSRATRFFSGAFTFAGRPTENFGYAVTYHGLLTRGSFREGPAIPGSSNDFIFFDPFAPTRNNYEGRVHTVNARTDFRLGRANSVTAGYEFEDESFVNRSTGPTLSDNSGVDVRERSHAFFVQDQLRFFSDRLQLSAAFRAQTFKLDAPRFTPSANAPFRDIAFVSPPRAFTGDGSVAYLFRSTGTKLRGHVGNGYRKPSLFERFGTFFSSFSGGFGPLGDPRLAPERSLAFDAGVDQTFGDRRVRLSATYFYTRLQEVVDFGDTPNDPFGRVFGGYLNTGGGLARGLELSATLAPTRTLDLFASYTYTNSDVRRPIVENIIRAFAIPDHQFTFVATERIGARVFVNFDLVASSDYLAPIFDNNSFRTRAYRFDGLLKADVTASYTLPLRDSRALRFFGKIENLFDRQYFENGFRTPGIHGRAGTSFSF
ncbi:MAG: TonB-dependent receptor [Pyrinomonadaceae bacterium]